MAQSIGVIQSITGSAKAEDANGNQRTLSQGDQIFSNEKIITDAGSQASVRFNDGSQYAVGESAHVEFAYRPMSDMQPVAEVMATPQETTTSTTQDADVDAIQAAILAGQDPTQVAEATAAGAAGGNATGSEGSNSFVVIAANKTVVTPVSGFETTTQSPTIAQAEQDPLNQNPSEPAQVEPIPGDDDNIPDDGGDGDGDGDGDCDHDKPHHDKPDHDKPGHPKPPIPGDGDHDKPNHGDDDKPKPGDGNHGKPGNGDNQDKPNFDGRNNHDKPNHDGDDDHNKPDVSFRGDVGDPGNPGRPQSPHGLGNAGDPGDPGNPGRPQSPHGFGNPGDPGDPNGPTGPGGPIGGKDGDHDFDSPVDFRHGEIDLNPEPSVGSCDPCDSNVGHPGEPDQAQDFDGKMIASYLQQNHFGDVGDMGNPGRPQSPTGTGPGNPGDFGDVGNPAHPKSPTGVGPGNPGDFADAGNPGHPESPTGEGLGNAGGFADAFGPANFGGPIEQGDHELGSVDSPIDFTRGGIELGDGFEHHNAASGEGDDCGIDCAPLAVHEVLDVQAVGDHLPGINDAKGHQSGPDLSHDYDSKMPMSGGSVGDDQLAMMLNQGQSQAVDC